MAINNISISNVMTDLFVSASNSALTVIYLCNTGVSTVTVDLHVIPSGDSASTTNMIYSGISIPGNDTYIIDTERMILEVGDKVSAISSIGGAVSATISSMGI